MRHRNEHLIKEPEIDLSIQERREAATLRWIRKLVTGVKGIRSRVQIPLSTRIRIILSGGTEEEQNNLGYGHETICEVTRAESLTWLSAGRSLPPSASCIVDETVVHVLLQRPEHQQRELQWLNSRITSVSLEYEQLSAKLEDALNSGDEASASVVRMVRIEKMNELTVLYDDQDRLTEALQTKRAV